MANLTLVVAVRLDEAEIDRGPAPLAHGVPLDLHARTYRGWPWVSRALPESTPMSSLGHLVVWFSRRAVGWPYTRPAESFGHPARCREDPGSDGTNETATVGCLARSGAENGAGTRKSARLGFVAITVFITDDHEVVREGVRRILEAGGDITVVGEAATVGEAAVEITRTRPQVAVLDVRLPDGSGIELCREIRSTHPEIACLILTSFADDEALAQAVLAGASGYVLKQIRATNLVQSVRAVAAGHQLIEPVTRERALERLRSIGAKEQDGSRLTPREQEILELIAAGKTNRQIGAELYLAEKTVKNYVSNLLAKLGMARRSEAAAYAARLEERHRHTTDRSGADPTTLG
jgi:two-component system response regulator DevR